MQQQPIIAQEENAEIINEEEPVYEESEEVQIVH
jgi:hypothetical protein